MNNISQLEYERIEKLVNMAVHARTKKDAAVYIDQLRVASVGITGSAATVMSKLISSTAAATGRISDKERRLYFCNQDLGSLQTFVE